MKDKKKKTKSQIGRMSRSKGANYELQIAKVLSLWWTNGRDNKAFRRTPMSGGWDHRHAAGDLIAPEPSFPIHIEIRKREEFELGQLLKDGPVMNWLVEGESKCPAGQDLWYIMSRNCDQHYLFMCNAVWERIFEHGTQMTPASPRRIKLIQAGCFNIGWSTVLLKDFLVALTPDQFRQSYGLEIVQRIKHRGVK